MGFDAVYTHKKINIFCKIKDQQNNWGNKKDEEYIV
jgi:hypothetical protein